MAEARALFKRHLEELSKTFSLPILQSDLKDCHVTAIANIYAACIIAEAIRNEQEDVDLRVIEPKAG